MTSSPEPLVQVQKIHRSVSHNTLFQNCTNGSDLQNKIATRAVDYKYPLMTPAPEPLTQI